MRVLADFHHAGLLNSLIMLFEGRLGMELYRPIGIEWADEGFWQVYDHPATRAQYLTLSQGFQPEDGSRPLNVVLPELTDDTKGVYFCQDIDSGKYNKAITLPAFKDTKFDIIIASLPQHIQPFKRLIKLYQPQAKLIFQVGNQWDGIEADNIMASARLHNVPEHINHVEYHQEFDLNLFKPSDDETKTRNIKSFMNCPDVFPDYPLLLELERALPDWTVSIHGGQGRDGALHGSEEVAAGVRSTRFMWQVKHGGDGYGHILFNSAACGVPTIVKLSDYAGKLGEKLLIDGETCIAIDGLSISDIVHKIQGYADPLTYSYMSARVLYNFDQKVDFDEDERNIRAFIDRLK